MSIFRIAIATTIVCIALRLEPAEREAVIQTGREHVAWVLNTCQRDPEFCKTAHGKWQRFTAELEDQIVVSAKALRQYAVQAMKPDKTGFDGSDPFQWSTGSTPAQLDEPSSGTLKMSDLKPAWSFADQPSSR
ncbi:MAG: hypothetical protein AAFO75_05435 [Pseudomonadota bacterium]